MSEYRSLQPVEKLRLHCETTLKLWDTRGNFYMTLKVSPLRGNSRSDTGVTSQRGSIGGTACHSLPEVNHRKTSCRSHPEVTLLGAKYPVTSEVIERKFLFTTIISLRWNFEPSSYWKHKEATPRLHCYNQCNWPLENVKCSQHVVGKVKETNFTVYLSVSRIRGKMQTSLYLWLLHGSTGLCSAEPIRPTVSGCFVADCIAFALKCIFQCAPGTVARYCRLLQGQLFRYFSSGKTWKLRSRSCWLQFEFILLRHYVPEAIYECSLCKMGWEGAWVYNQMRKQ